MTDSSEDVLRAVAALGLARVRRFDRAQELMPGCCAALHDLLRFQSGATAPASAAGSLHQALEGWSQYYQARYAGAASLFAHVVASDCPWLCSWAALGLAKVATDEGFFRRAAEWCALSAAVAREHEHTDLLAMAAGALGELLLRGGHPAAALDAFSLDLALLPAGDLFRGRVLCYQAHAYARLGEESWPAAELGYRLAQQTPGEETAPFAWAGLALLGARMGKLQWVEQAIEHCSDQPHLGHALCFLARARLQAAGAPLDLQRALSLLPGEYRYERAWLRAWAGSLGVELDPPAASAPVAEIAEPQGHPAWGLVTGFDHWTAGLPLYDDGFSRLEWPDDEAACWQAREMFMP